MTHLRDSPTVTLRDLTATNWNQVAALQVKPEQSHFVAPNIWSIAEAKYGFSHLPHLKLIPLAIYYRDDIVGFAMYNVGPEQDRFFIMRLMIEAKHQGCGYGKAAMLELLKIFSSFPHAKEVAISYQWDNNPARQLYAACGFEEVGHDDNGCIAWRELNPQPQAWTLLWNLSET